MLFIRDTFCPARVPKIRFATALLLSVFGACGNAALAAASDASDDKLVALVKDAARQQLQRLTDSAGLLEPQFDIIVLSNASPARPAPPCAQAVSIQGVDTRMPSRMRFAAVCRAAEAWKVEFVVRANISAKVVMAAGAIPAGKPFTATDLVLEQRDVTATPDAVSNLDAALGMVSRRAVLAGDVLRQSLLAAPVLVKRGDAVRIVVRREQIEISVAGEAMEAGTRNEAVRVRNVNTGNIIRARVVGPATVEPVDIALSTQSPD